MSAIHHEKQTLEEQGPHCALLSDGRRLHLQHGPIDLVIEAWGGRSEVISAYWQAQSAFRSVLCDLVDELPILRRPVTNAEPTLSGPVACRMVNAVQSHDGVFVTPMAAVAGAVADHILEALLRGRNLTKASINNGGDIALYLSPWQQFDIGIVGDLTTGRGVGTLTLSSDDGVGGIATSGWQGRSHSLGIANAVTVLAETAAKADVAATLIANAVDLPGSTKVSRVPANEEQPDSDLCSRRVTVDVAPLDASELSNALMRGRERAVLMQTRGELISAFLCLQGQVEIVRGAHENFLHSDKCSMRKKINA